MMRSFAWVRGYVRVGIAVLTVGIGLGGMAFGLSYPSAAGMTDFGHFNQGPRDVAVTGSNAVTADTHGLTIYDISDPAHITKRGEVLLPDSGHGLAVVGTTAYVADGGAGLQIVDISDPAAPALIGSCEIPGQALDLAVSGSVAYVAAQGAGLQVVDVSDPSHPAIVGSVGTSSVCYDVAVSGHLVYVAAGSGGLVIIDVSNPAAPTILAAQSLSDNAHGVAISGNTAYVGTSQAHVFTIDVSDPAHPSVLGTVKLPQWAERITMAGTLAYVADYPGGVQVIDVSDPAHPQIIGSYDTADYAYSVAVSGNTAYVAEADFGLQTLDVSDPTNPTLLGSFAAGGFAYSATAAGGFVYVADGSAGLQVVDATDPDHPHVAGHLDLDAYANSIALSGPVAYVANYWAGLAVIDVSQPSGPKLLAQFNGAGRAEDIAVQGSTVYVASDAGLKIIGVSDPAHPVLLGHYDTPGRATAIAVSGAIAYVADGDSLLTFDVSDPARPTLLATFDSGWIKDRGVALEGHLLFYAAGSNGLKILDVTDPASPVALGSFYQDGSAEGVSVTGSIAWVAIKDAGWQMIDVSDPSHPSIVASDDEAPRSPTGIAADSSNGTVWITEGAVMEGVHMTGSSTCPTLTVTANPASITVGGATSTVTVTVKDGSGAPMPGLQLTGWPASGTLSAFTDQGGGTYTATFTSGTIVGWTGITVSLTGAPCEGTGQIHLTFPANPSLDQLAGHLKMIPAAGHNPGKYGTVWRTDAVLTNPGDRAAAVALFFLPAGQDNTGVTGHSLTVPAGASLALDDIVLATFGKTSYGAVLLSSDEPLFVTSRTYNDASSGTYGQLVPGVPFAQAITGDEAVHLIQLTRNSSFHTNIGFANATGTPLHVTVHLYRADGSPIASHSYSVLSYGFLQKTDIIGTDVDDAYAIVSSDTANARYFTYASVMDNNSGDPIFVLPATASDEPLVVPAAAHVHGVAGTDWRTDVEIYNAGSSSTRVYVEPLLLNQANPAPLSATFDIDPGQSLRLPDILDQVFDISGSAALRITSEWQKVIVTSRTYNVVGPKTFGQFIPALPLSAATGAVHGGRLVQLSQAVSDTSGFRTNIGLTNATGVTTNVIISLYDASGNHLGDVSKALKPYEFVQVGKIFRRVTGSTIKDGYAVVSSPTAGAAFYAYASVIDNVSGDPINIPAMW